jgi:hypothetical protein
MKKTVMVEFEKSEIEGLDWNQGRRAIMNKFLDSYRIIGQFIAQQVCKDRKEPKKMILGIEIWRGLPMRRGIKVIIDKGSLDKLKKYQRFQVISRLFLCAYQAMGELCVERICRGKSEPRKIVVRVEVN